MGAWAPVLQRVGLDVTQVLRSDDDALFS